LKERTNQEWLTEVRLAPPRCNEAMQALRSRLAEWLTYAFSKRPGVDRSLLEDLAQEALLRILDRLDSFRGESRFLTRTHTIAVRVVLTELRKARWRDVSLESFEGRENMSKSALYKLLHDARLRLKRALLERGLSVEEITEAFECGA
jgi:RNA polymerase sigma-70 factor (ECF subfamily)